MSDDAFHLTALDARRYDFGNALRGYDRARVDQFRDQVADELERLSRANQELEVKARNFHEQLRAFRERDKALNDALISAQQLRGEIREQAQREAQLIIREAQGEAERALDNLRGEIRRAEDELQQLWRNRRSYLVQLRSVMERELAALDNADMAPPPTGVAVRASDASSAPRASQREVAPEPTRDTMRDAVREPVREAVREPTRDAVREPAREGVRVAAPESDQVRELRRELLRDIPRDLSRETTGDAAAEMAPIFRSAVRESDREGAREDARNGAREPLRLTPRDVPRVAAREPVAEPVREPAREAPREPLLERREMPRQPWAREAPQVPRSESEFVEERLNERPRDINAPRPSIPTPSWLDVVEDE